MRRMAGLIVLLLIASTFSTALAQEEQYIHVVQQGENLFRISLKYDVDMDSIMEANGLTDPTRILAGQKLIIPGYSPESPTLEATGLPSPTPTASPSPESTPTPTPEPIPTLTPEPVEPQSAGAAQTASVSHLVLRGETLTRIAAQYNVTVWSVAQANQLASINTISAGQLLTIPGVELEPEVVEKTIVTETMTTTEQVYVVQAGDTLTRIAQQFGSTVAELVDLNKIINPSAIYPGQTLRLMRTAPVMAGFGKRILVDISEQHLYAYEDEQLVFSYIASTGMAPTYTKAGQFQVQSKIDNAYGATWDIWMPFWLGIYYAGSTENGIHALPIMSNGQTLWSGYLGTPISYGCVVLGTEEAETLYNWAPIGTPVTIQY